MHKIKVGDVLMLRKGHPCGTNEWKVIRGGADVKLQCVGCSRVVMLDRPVLLKRIKKVISQGD